MNWPHGGKRQSWHRTYQWTEPKSQSIEDRLDAAESNAQALKRFCCDMSEQLGFVEGQVLDKDERKAVLGLLESGALLRR